MIESESEREKGRDLLSSHFSPFIKMGINRGQFSTALQWGEVLSVKGLVWFKLAWETCDRFTWKAARGLSVNNSLPVYFCLSRLIMLPKYRGLSQLDYLNIQKWLSYSFFLCVCVLGRRGGGNHYLSMFVRDYMLHN